jgi:hypothetical protein
MSDRLQPFRPAIQAAGLEPLEHIQLGQFHFFPGADRLKGNTAGWYKLFPSGMGDPGGHPYATCR